MPLGYAGRDCKSEKGRSKLTTNLEGDASADYCPKEHVLETQASGPALGRRQKMETHKLKQRAEGCEGGMILVILKEPDR